MAFWLTLTFALGLLSGAALSVLLILAGVGAFTLVRALQAQRDAKVREARILQAIAREQRVPDLQPQPLVAFPWLPKSRMD
jgi:hypothetical protein